VAPLLWTCPTGLLDIAGSMTPMTPAELFPCSCCNTLEESAARHCSRCGSSLLVDVIITQPVSDPKSRYALARKLGELRAAQPFAELKTALGAAGQAVLRQATLSDAATAQAMVESHGGKVQQVRQEVSIRRRRLALAALPLLAVIIVAGAWWMRIRRETRLSDPVATLYCKSLTNQSLEVRAAAFFVSEDLILSGAHAECGINEKLVAKLSDGRMLGTELLRRDEFLDVALFRVPGAKATPLRLGGGAGLAVGTSVAVLPATTGRKRAPRIATAVSNPLRVQYGIGFVQIDLTLADENIGAPVVDRNGRVVALITSGVQGADGIALALPIEYVYLADEAPLLAAPADPPPDLAAWQARQGDVRAADEQEQAQWSLEKPAAFHGFFGSTGTCSVNVSQRVVGVGPGTLDAIVRFNGKTACKLALHRNGEWQAIQNAYEFTRSLYYGGPPDGFRLRLAWMERHDLIRGLSVAQFRNDVGVYESCGRPPRGTFITVELVDGQPGLGAQTVQPEL
jgi:S1-C subfamily serine protease